MADRIAVPLTGGRVPASKKLAAATIGVGGGVAAAVLPQIFQGFPELPYESQQLMAGVLVVYLVVQGVVDAVGARRDHPEAETRKPPLPAARQGKLFHDSTLPTPGEIVRK